MEISNSNKNSNTFEDSKKLEEGILKVEPLTSKITLINSTKSKNSDSKLTGSRTATIDEQRNAYGGNTIT